MKMDRIWPILFLIGVLSSLPAVGSPPSHAQAQIPALRYIGFSPVVSPGDNADLRRAVCVALDREAIARAVAAVLSPQQAPIVRPASAIQNPDLPAYNPEVRGCRFDPALAKQYLEKANWTAGITIFVGNNPPRVHQVFYAAVTDNLRQTLGIPSTVQGVNFDSLFRQLKSGSVAVYMHRWFGLSTDACFPSFALCLGERFTDVDAKVKELVQAKDIKALEQYLLDQALIVPVIWEPR